jgi:outer membrane protein
MNKYLNIFLVVIVVTAVSVSVWAKLSIPKISFVRIGKIVEDYRGMKEARIIYQKKAEGWENNFDTLKTDYERTLKKYNEDLTKLNKEDRKIREEYLRRLETNLREYSISLQNKAKEEDGKLTQGVLNQINSFVEEYGEKHGYNVVFGTTGNGNILYGKDSDDITETVIKELNDSYKSTTNEVKK